MRVGRRWLKHHRHVPIAAEDHADHILAAFKKAIKKAGPRSSCRSRAALTAASAAATLSRPAYRRRPTQQLRQLGEVHRQPPRLVARQPIWSPSDAILGTVCQTKRSNASPFSQTERLTAMFGSSKGRKLVALHAA